MRPGLVYVCVRCGGGGGGRQKKNRIKKNEGYGHVSIMSIFAK